MSNQVYIVGFIFLLVSIALYQYQKQAPQTLSVEERTAIALRKTIGNRTSSYRNVAVGYVPYVCIKFTFICTGKCKSPPPPTREMRGIAEIRTF